MPIGGRKDRLAGYHFYVDIEGVFQGTFRECSGMSTQSDVIEYWSGAKEGDTQFSKIPGRVKYNDITLKGGLAEDTKGLWDWRGRVEKGEVDKARQNGTIYMFDQGNKAVAKWRFEDAWPTKLAGPGLNAGSNDVAVEELTIAIEKLTREK
jgi:phage tail-like protein